MTILSGSFRQAAEEIKGSMFSDTAKLTGILYNMLTRRDHEDTLLSIYNAYYKSKSHDYFDRLESVKAKLESLPHPVETRYGNGYLNFKYLMKSPRPKQSIGLWNITHKEYFTFMPQQINPEDVYKEIAAFISHLPVICERVYTLNATYDDIIQIKVPSSLFSLLKSPDSLVIHYRTAGLGNQIRAVVRDVYHAAGVKLSRTIKSDYGFDFKHRQVHYGMSHSMLVAEVLARMLIENREKVINMSNINLAAWLEASVRTVSQWGIKQMHSHLFSHELAHAGVA